ncbi:MAG TPA: ATP-binding protein [Candidatus Cloacimonadota bacterium]|nr:ATP-binding protein [Candidatus Cloacimonadota bacterium]HPT71445.1 ATP-binding protein [Candidatus Cloacimonadota bacterium]
MRIQSKIQLLVVIFLSIFLLFLLIYSESQRHVKNILIQSDQQQKEILLSNILRMQRNQHFNLIRSNIIDLADHGNSSKFQNAAWLEQNLNPLLKKNDINFLWVFNTSGKLIYSASDDTMLQPDDFQFSTLLFDKLFKTPDNFFSKYANSTCIIINGLEIPYSYSKNDNSKTECYVLTGKIWNLGVLSTLIKGIGYSVKIAPYDQYYEHSQNLEGHQNQDYVTFNLADENGRPVALIEFIRSNVFIHKFDTQSLATFIMFCFFGGLITIISFSLLRHWINIPLKKISASLRFDNLNEMASLERDHTEFGEIATLIDNFYLQKKQLEDEIAEKQEIADTLRISEAKNKALLKAIPDYMFIVDESGMVVDYNSQPQQLTNLKISEFLDQKLSDLLPKSIADEAMQHELKTLTNNDNEHQEFSLTIDDQVRNFEARFAKCTDTTVLIMVRDVTNLKESEQALRISEELNRAIVEGSPLGITVRSNTGKLLAYNRAWRKIWAISDESIQLDLNRSRDEMSFDSRDEYLDKWQEAVKQVYEKGGTLYIPEAKTVGKRSGSAEWIAQYFYAIMDQSGKVDRVVILTEDISERKRAQMELLTAKEQAEDANRAKTVFLANMSHEMRTPLNGILGMVQLIMENEKKKDILEQMQIIQSSASVLLQLITQILDYSKLEAENLKVEDSEFSIRELLLDIQRKYKIKAKEKKISLEMTFDDDVPEIIRSDAKRISQIMSNLVDNGIKFSEKGTVACNVQIESGLSNVNMLHLTVKDQGIGIPLEKHDLVFKSFIQSNPTTTPAAMGTGLGLAICKRIVEQMNGRIWLESQVGQGTIFHVILPLTSHDRVVNIPNQHRISEPELEQINAHPLKILVAEDNLINQKVLIRMLERMGHKAGLALDGKQAIELWEKEPFDLILMDIQMPEMNGIEATIQIREREKEKGGHIPIIAVTAYAMVGDKEKFLVAGMDEYIPKPINVNQLQEVLQKITEWKKS